MSCIMLIKNTITQPIKAVYFSNSILHVSSSFVFISIQSWKLEIFLIGGPECNCTLCASPIHPIPCIETFRIFRTSYFAPSSDKMKKPFTHKKYFNGVCLWHSARFCSLTEWVEPVCILKMGEIQSFWNSIFRLSCVIFISNFIFQRDKWTVVDILFPDKQCYVQCFVLSKPGIK